MIKISRNDTIIELGASHREKNREQDTDEIAVFLSE